MSSIPNVSAKTNSGLVDDHDPSDIAQKSQQEGPAAYAPHDKGEKTGIVRDERGQEKPADKKRAQENTGTPQVSQTGQSSGYSSGDKKE